MSEYSIKDLDLTPFPLNTTASEMPIIHVQGKWEIPLLLWFNYNYSSPLYELWNTVGYRLNDSAVLANISVQTPGLVLYDVVENSVNLPIPLTSAFFNMAMVIFNIETMQYKGPLNITLNVTSPATNMVIYKPNVSIINAPNQSSPVTYAPPIFNVTWIGGLQFGESGDYAAFCNESIPHTVALCSSSNFSISKVLLNYPFTALNVSYVSAERAVETHYYTNDTTIWSGPYLLDFTFNILLPPNPYNCTIDITVFTQNS